MTFELNKLPVDSVALTGYLALFGFFAYKLTDTFKRPADLVANVLLLVGLASFIVYHYRKLMENIDETNSTSQKNTRIVAHSTIAAFFVITVTAFSNAKYSYYDTFALIGHVFLLWAVSTGNLQLIGFILLALYFIFASYRKVSSQIGAETVNMIGRVLLAIYFVTLSVIGLIEVAKR